MIKIDKGQSYMRSFTGKYIHPSLFFYILHEDGGLLEPALLPADGGLLDPNLLPDYGHVEHGSPGFLGTALLKKKWADIFF